MHYSGVDLGCVKLFDFQGLTINVIFLFHSGKRENLVFLYFLFRFFL
jgi:hypothetical protein